MNALVALVEKDITNVPINIASKNYISIRELADKIIQLTNSKSKIEYKNNETFQREKIINTKKAQNMINFTELVSLDEGLKQTITAFSKTFSID